MVAKLVFWGMVLFVFPMYLQAYIHIRDGQTAVGIWLAIIAILAPCHYYILFRLGQDIYHIANRILPNVVQKIMHEAEKLADEERNG